MTGSIFGVKNGLSDVCQESFFVSKEKSIETQKVKVEFRRIKISIQKVHESGAVARKSRRFQVDFVCIPAEC